MDEQRPFDPAGAIMGAILRRRRAEREFLKSYLKAQRGGSKHAPGATKSRHVRSKAKTRQQRASRARNR